MRVFVTHNPEDLAAYYGRALPELRSLTEHDGTPVEVVLNPLERDLTTPELIKAAAGCEVIVAHRAAPGDAKAFLALPDLLAFLRCAVDISTVDVGAASAAGVLVARADKSFVPSTAELALGLLLDCARTIAASTIDYRNGKQPPQRLGWQLAGQTAGILGYGAIGSYLAGLLAGIGMRVFVHDPFVLEVGDVAELVERGQLLAEFFVAQRQRDLGFLDDQGKLSRAQKRHGADGDGAGLDHAEPASGEHRRVGGAQQHPVARDHAQILGEHLGDAVGFVL